jgi:hypothetical protein
LVVFRVLPFDQDDLNSTIIPKESDSGVRAGEILPSRSSGIFGDPSAAAFKQVTFGTNPFERQKGGSIRQIGFHPRGIETPSRTLGHGIWTYHLLRALRGEELESVERDGLITSNSLQSYLAKMVPATVRATCTGKAQARYLYGTQSREFLIADVGPLISAGVSVVGPDGPVRKRIEVPAQKFAAVRNLDGFD